MKEKVKEVVLTIGIFTGMAGLFCETDNMKFFSEPILEDYPDEDEFENAHYAWEVAEDIWIEDYLDKRRED